MGANKPISIKPATGSTQKKAPIRASTVSQKVTEANENNSTNGQSTEVKGGEKISHENKKTDSKKISRLLKKTDKDTETKGPKSPSRFDLALEKAKADGSLNITRDSVAAKYGYDRNPGRKDSEQQANQAWQNSPNVRTPSGGGISPGGSGQQVVQRPPQQPSVPPSQPPVINPPSNPPNQGAQVFKGFRSSEITTASNAGTAAVKAAAEAAGFRSVSVAATEAGGNIIALTAGEQANGKSFGAFMHHIREAGHILDAKIRFDDLDSATAAADTLRSRGADISDPALSEDGGYAFVSFNNEIPEIEPNIEVPDIEIPNMDDQAIA